MVDGQKLYDLDIENRQRVQTKANVYKAKVTGSSPALRPPSSTSALIATDSSLSEISPEYYRSRAPENEGRSASRMC